MKAKGTVRLGVSSEKQLTALINALTPEVQKQIGTRSKITLTRDSQFLVLDVEAQDTVAMRAVLNAYLRWINSTINILETVEKVS